MTSPTRGQSTILDEVKHRSGWAVFLGVVTMIVGVVLLIYPFATATMTTIFLACMLLLAGGAELVLALASQTPGTFFLRLVIGVLYGFTGIVLLVNPFTGTESLTLFVGWMLVIRGIFVMVAAFRLRPIEGWGWLVADSIASLAAGVLILVKWPSSTTWAVGTLVGASVLMTGLTRTVMAARIRRGSIQVQQLAKGAA